VVFLVLLPIDWPHIKTARSLGYAESNGTLLGVILAENVNLSREDKIMFYILIMQICTNKSFYNKSPFAFSPFMKLTPTHSHNVLIVQI
jgi:hypothetical protein